MKTLVRISDHIVRLQRQLGKKVRIGGQSFATKGYISNNLSVDYDSNWELELNDVYRHALKSDGFFIDVGMNLGQTLGKVLALDPNHKYLGFEPQVLACAMVDVFIRQNRLTNCTTVAIGLSNENGIRSFFGRGGIDTMASLHGQNKEGVEMTSIQVRRGDEVIKEMEIEAICAIKIDVEGSEAEVIEGLSLTIKSFKPPVIFEVLPNYVGHDRTPVSNEVAKHRSNNAIKIINLFTELDYSIYQILRNGTEYQIDEFDLDNPSSFLGTNYVARPN